MYYIIYNVIYYIQCIIIINKCIKVTLQYFKYNKKYGKLSLTNKGQ